ncbi:MAG: MbcA/ParS/Xre antitoxin family protein [Bryobacteraceae bacterium]|jgi:putative toxin-antitoxin system antitoxin component (TIGR02293 family)|nr:MbcA/ParS/Xre antitoxin family protein [Bryobacteraceae bacterium]
MTSALPLARLVPIVAHAVAVFGDEQKATHWLTTPLALFDNQPPMELLATSEGIERVERTLTRIEHNIPS